MSQVVVDLSMSLDGFVTGPRPSLTRGLGIGGEVIHAWAMPPGRTDPDLAVLDQGFTATGAVVMGRRTFDFVDQLRLHVAPALLGDGTPLFRRGSAGARLVHRRTVSSPEAIHVTYDVAY